MDSGAGNDALAGSDATLADGGSGPGDRHDAATSDGGPGLQDAGPNTTDAGDASQFGDASDGSPPPVDGGCGAACPPPTCTVEVAPGSGAPSATYTGTLASTGATTCTATVDGNQPLAVPCNGMTTWPGTSFGGVGHHTVVVKASGSGGVTNCVAAWTVASPSTPTCTLSVTPAQGATSATYTATLASSGATSCTFRVDNGAPIGTQCTSTQSFAGSLLGAGTHVAVVTASGAGGAGSCSASWIEQ